MKLDEKMCMVISELEYLVGSECYNPHSYDGWNDIEGCSFRYPVNYPDGEGGFLKMKNHIKYNGWRFNSDGEYLTEDRIPFMKYKFGANELFIGKGLINVMRYLEQRYDLDFNELEAQLAEEEEQG